MPTVITLQDFFVVAGLFLFVLSLFSGPIEVKDIRIPTLSDMSNTEDNAYAYHPSNPRV